VGRLAPVVLGTAGAGFVAKGADFSTDGKSHQLVTYLGFYGVGVALLVVGFLLWWLSREARPSSGPTAEVSESPSGAAAAAQDTGAGSVSGNVIQDSIVASPGAFKVGGDLNLAPQPAGMIWLTSENEPWVDEYRGTRYVTKATIRVDAAYAAKGLRVTVEANHVGDFEVEPMAGGMSYISGKVVDETFGQCLVHAPLANEYEVLVFTGDTDAVEVIADLVV
jgi:hypothetical protein